MIFISLMVLQFLSSFCYIQHYGRYCNLCCGYWLLHKRDVDELSMSSHITVEVFRCVLFADCSTFAIFMSAEYEGPVQVLESMWKRKPRCQFSVGLDTVSEENYVT